MRVAATFVLLIVLCASACKAPPLAEGNVESRVQEASAPPMRLGAGDRVRVVVFGHPENSTPEEGLLIDSEGHLDLPLIGPVALAGLTPNQARERLNDEFARFLRDPRVSLNLMDSGSRRVYVFGEVDQAGAYPLDRSLNALQALSLAGGFRPGADRSQVALLRGSQDALQVYFFNAETPGADGLVAVQPDDFLFVRLSGAGSFRDQILPIIQGVVPPITALASLLILADRLAE